MKHDYDVFTEKLNPPIGGEIRYYAKIYKDGHLVQGEWHGKTEQEARDKAWKVIKDLGDLNE